LERLKESVLRSRPKVFKLELGWWGNAAKETVFPTEAEAQVEPDVFFNRS
jgi:hypothetical protein